jgi:hypothetical protein
MAFGSVRNWSGDVLLAETTGLKSWRKAHHRSIGVVIQLPHGDA